MQGEPSLVHILEELYGAPLPGGVLLFGITPVLSCSEAQAPAGPECTPRVGPLPSLCRSQPKLQTSQIPGLCSDCRYLRAGYLTASGGPDSQEAWNLVQPSSLAHMPCLASS